MKSIKLCILSHFLHFGLPFQGTRGSIQMPQLPFFFFLNAEFRRQLDARILFHTYTNCQQIEELTAKMCLFSSLLKPSFEKQTQRAWIIWKLDLPLQDNPEVAYKQILRIFYIITHQNSQSLNFSIHTFFCTHIVSESAHKNSLNYFFWRRKQGKPPWSQGVDYEWRPKAIKEPLL